MSIGARARVGARASSVGSTAKTASMRSTPSRHMRRACACARLRVRVGVGVRVGIRVRVRVRVGIRVRVRVSVRLRGAHEA